jgi:PPK2 family polyphosphate:nucleotide phosphotransferase
MSIKLKKISSTAPKSVDKQAIKNKLPALYAKLAQYQTKFTADGKYSLMIIIQGMDASGKDGVIKKVFGGMDQNVVDVVSFKEPTDEEYAQDFLRRIHMHAPAKWHIQIMNRSHYEDILVPSVHKLLPKKTIQKRYNHINDFEEILADSGTKVIKCFLHVSPEKQLERLYERLVNPLKHRKHKDRDREVRKDRDKYQEVYETIFDTCDLIPRHVIPADQNWYKTRVLGNILLDEFKKLDLQYPPLVSKYPEKVLEAKERREKQKAKKDEKKAKKDEKKAKKDEKKAKKDEKKAKKDEKKQDQTSTSNDKSSVKK